MKPTKLEDACCYFATDRVGGPAMTAFKQEARWRQHRWAVEERGVSVFGTHRGRGTGPDGQPAQVNNGTKLNRGDADAGLNFLSDDIRSVVDERVGQHGDAVKHQTFNIERLRRDLLSSMPMAFNLFAEASVHEESRNALASLFGVEAGPSDIVFEWSPGRRNGRYTNDRTAFDVSLRVGISGGPKTVVGIETKYHEHSTREAPPKSSQQTDFLVGKAVASDAFVDGWQDAVLGADLRQIWRDHLLALSMREHPDEWTASTRYVLIYPRANVSFSDAVTRYAALLQPGDTSFAAFTIEQVLDAAFAHGGPTKDVFRRRYLFETDRG